MYISPDHTKCISLNNQKWIAQPSLINLDPNEYIEGTIHFHTFAINLDRCVRSRNYFNDLPNRLCVSNKTENVNASAFSIITGINK